jgi:mannose-6-phosphate isomerase-like protein (cupin superfamily)
VLFKYVDKNINNIKMKLNYDNRIVIKPWGEEYNIFRNKNKIAITYLKLKKGFSTSLHCHPNKKTGFLILSGTAEVQLGIYKNNIFKYPPMSILVLRAGLFHKIKASKNQDLHALEIENPYIKKDLIRMTDDYGRQGKAYENLKNTKKISQDNVIFKIPSGENVNKYILDKININISHYRNFNKFNKFDDKSVSIILDGNIKTHDGKIVISVGEIVKSFTLKKLSEFFKVDKRILILKASKK